MHVLTGTHTETNVGRVGMEEGKHYSDPTFECGR